MKKLIPFSNASEAVSWYENNCEPCRRPCCKHGKHMQMGFVIGFIFESTADFIGYSRITSRRDMNTVQLLPRCNNYTDEPQKRPRAPKKDENQQRLF